jgi:hypothetical protein
MEKAVQSAGGNRAGLSVYAGLMNPQVSTMLVNPPDSLQEADTLIPCRAAC